MKVAEKSLKHGTYSTYCNARCRCDACREAASKYNAKRWALKKAHREGTREIRIAGDVMERVLEDEVMVYMGAERGWETVSLPALDDDFRPAHVRRLVSTKR